MSTTIEHVPDQTLSSSLAWGLRAVADFVETNPHLAQHLQYSFGRVLTAVNHADDPRRAMGDFARAAGKAMKTYDDQWAGLDIAFGSLVSLHVYAAREKVCERIVTGTHEVTEEVVDPDALAALPKVTVTKTVEDVEWICSPLLAEQSS